MGRWGNAGENRGEDLRIILDQVTARLSDPSTWMLPIVHELCYDPLGDVPGGYLELGSFCSVGFASRFADQGSDPAVASLPQRHSALPSHRGPHHDLHFAEDVRTDGGHLWLPLDLPGEMAGPVLVDHVVPQVHAVQAVLATPG